MGLRFADAGGQAGKVAVAAHQAEAVHAAAVQHVHGVDDEGRVGGVLARGVAELLYGLDGQRVQHLFPAFEVAAGPVAISALDGGSAVARHFSQQFADNAGLRVVCVNEYGQLVVGIGCHGVPLLFPAW